MVPEGEQHNQTFGAKDGEVAEPGLCATLTFATGISAISM